MKTTFSCVFHGTITGQQKLHLQNTSVPLQTRPMAERPIPSPVDYDTQNINICTNFQSQDPESAPAYNAKSIYYASFVSTCPVPKLSVLKTR